MSTANATATATKRRNFSQTAKVAMVNEAIDRKNFYRVAQEHRVQRSALYKWRKSLNHLLKAPTAPVSKEQVLTVHQPTQ